MSNCKIVNIISYVKFFFGTNDSYWPNSYRIQWPACYLLLLRVHSSKFPDFLSNDYFPIYQKCNLLDKTKYNMARVNRYHNHLPNTFDEGLKSLVLSKSIKIFYLSICFCNVEIKRFPSNIIMILPSKNVSYCLCQIDTKWNLSQNLLGACYIYSRKTPLQSRDRTFSLQISFCI